MEGTVACAGRGRASQPAERGSTSPERDPGTVAEAHPPGRAMPIRVMGEEFALYRGETGEPHLVGSRRAHRARQLSTGLGDRLLHPPACITAGTTPPCVSALSSRSNMIGSGAEARTRSYPTRSWRADLRLNQRRSPPAAGAANLRLRATDC